MNKCIVCEAEEKFKQIITNGYRLLSFISWFDINDNCHKNNICNYQYALQSIKRTICFMVFYIICQIPNR